MNTIKKKFRKTAFASCPHLGLGDGDGRPHYVPQDGLQERGGSQGPFVVPVAEVVCNGFPQGKKIVLKRIYAI